MSKSFNILKKYLANETLSHWLFFAAIFTFIFWLVSKKINIYKYAFVGAIFELLWLAMLASVFIIPLISIAVIITQPISIKSLAIYSLLISIGTLLVLQFA